jgi:hypothetical protein
LIVESSKLKVSEKEKRFYTENTEFTESAEKRKTANDFAGE